MSIWSFIREKKANRLLSLRRRQGYGQNLTSNDQVKLRRSRLFLIFLWLRIKRFPKDVKLRKLAKAFLCRHILMSYAPVINFDSLVNNHITIEHFGETIKRDLRFEADHIRLLITELKFPDTVTFDNRIRMSGEEVFLRGLYELVTGNLKHIIANFFGRDFSCQVRAFSYFIDHIYNNFHHLVHNNLQWWYRNGFWEKSAAAIERKMSQRYPTEELNVVSHFIDCNCLETTVPGGGPAESGANAARWDVLIQRAFYNGWKSIHGMKHQTVDNAYGMTEDICGPTSLRRNDLAVLRRSNINDRFAALQHSGDIQYIIFGDSAYKKKSHITSYKKFQDMNRSQVHWNKSMKHVRISIEWNYGVTGSLFRYVRYKDKFKLMKSRKVSKIYTVATLFRNFHIALYGGQSSNYFDLVIPDDMLIHYIRNQDFDA